MKAVHLVTVASHFNILRAFFASLVEDGIITASPIQRLRPPVVRGDQVQPSSKSPVEALAIAFID